MPEDFPTLDLDAGECRPPEVDLSVPSVARVYDYSLGGKDNFAVDRAAADHVLEVLPEAPRLALENRAFLVRAVRHMAREHGITQFLDIGAGLPTMENTHQVAQQIHPPARVVYVDNDPIVLAHGRAILAEDYRTAILTADMRDIEAVFASAETRRLIDPNEPVGLLLVAIVHHLNDTDHPHALVRAYLDRMPSGSVLVLTHFYDPVDLTGEEGRTLAEKARRCEQIALTDFGSGRFRTRSEITAFFDGTEMDECGVEYLPRWRPDDEIIVDSAWLTDEQRLFLGGLGRKP